MIHLHGYSVHDSNFKWISSTEKLASSNQAWQPDAFPMIFPAIHGSNSHGHQASGDGEVRHGDMIYLRSKNIVEYGACLISYVCIYNICYIYIYTCLQNNNNYNHDNSNIYICIICLRLCNIAMEMDEHCPFIDDKHDDLPFLNMVVSHR